MTNHQEFHRIIDQIDTFFGRMGIGFTKKTQNPPFFYFVMFFTFEQFIQFNYYIMYHPADMFVKVQQFWGTMALAQVIIKGVNRKFHQHRMADLMQWFEEIYSKKVRDESQADLDKRLAEQNRQINNALWIFKGLWGASITFYTFQPIFLRTGGLPTPVTWRGTPDNEFSWPVLIVHYVTQVYNGYNVMYFSMASDSFFMVCVITLGQRLSTIGDNLRQLNYEGPRDRAKDRRIIIEACRMHLEVFDKTETFQSYFNIYGLFHLATPMIVDAMLLYNFAENGFDAMSACLAVSFFSQIFLAALFAEVLSTHAEDFSTSIYYLNWDDLDIAEQRFLHILLLRSQQKVTVVAGSYFELNFELVTKVVKFEVSFSAIVRNFKN